MIKRLGHHGVRAESGKHQPAVPAPEPALDPTPVDTAHLSGSKVRPRRNFKLVIQKGIAMALFAASAHLGGPHAVWAAGLPAGQPEKPPPPTVEEVDLTEYRQEAEREWYQAPVELMVQLQNKELDGRLGDYTWTVDPVEAKFRLKPRLKLDSAKLTAQSKLDVLKTQLAKVEQRGDWTVTQGLRGGLRFEGEVGHRVDWSESVEEAIAGQQLSLHLGAFQSWTKPVSDTTRLTISAEVGGSQNFTTGDTTVYAETRQKLQGEQLELWGHDFDWSAEAKQKVTVSADTGDVEARYEVFAGVEKSFPLEVFGRDVEATVKVGPKVSGDLEEGFHFSPMTRLSVDF